MICLNFITILSILSANAFRDGNLLDYIVLTLLAVQGSKRRAPDLLVSFAIETISFSHVMEPAYAKNTMSQRDRHAYKFVAMVRE